MGLWHLKRGEFAAAKNYFRRAIERLTRRNPNPYDSEAFYNLGLCLRFQGPDDEAYDSFYKATWSQAWVAAGYHALAEIDCLRKDWLRALDHLKRSLQSNTNNLRARNLKVLVLRRLNRPDEADEVLRGTVKLDSLDWWSRHLQDQKIDGDLQVKLDLAHDYARAGFFDESIAILKTATVVHGDLPDQSWGALPLIHYTLGWLYDKNGDKKFALSSLKRAATASSDYCFPSRLEEIAVLETAMRLAPDDARAPYYLGNLFYDRRRHREAIRLWEKSAKLDPDFSIVWRNLGIGYFNVTQNSVKARNAYEMAFKANPGDARLLYERDQLSKRLGDKPEKRLRELEKHLALVAQRDDLTVEICALYNQTHQPDKAARIVAGRKFQPWEGGEGKPLEQHVRAQMTLGRAAIARRDFARAKGHFESALASPLNLGEAKHLLANQSDIHFHLGEAFAGLGDKASARKRWLAAATFKGDFQEMRVRAFSEMTYYSALSLEKLGERAKAKKMLLDLLSYAKKLQKAGAKIDYFATSLPAMLLFEDDLQFRQKTTALFLQAQAYLGLGKKAKAGSLLRTVLARDPNHAPASDLLEEIGNENGTIPG
jgi:tetratricopeptide (TPR) repeat protein